MDARKFINDLGGYRSVAARIGKSGTTVHTHMQVGTLPPAWYVALCDVALERGVALPARSLFSFLELIDIPAPAEVAA
jgi:hypothetical protein